MAFDPADLSPIHDYWADDPALSAVSHTATYATQPDNGSGGDDLASKGADAFQMFRAEASLNNQSAFKAAGGTGADVTFGTPLAQPYDIVLVGNTEAAAYSFSVNITQLGPSGTGLVLGWNSGTPPTWHAAAGSTVNAPTDGRLIAGTPCVIHVHGDGSDSYVDVDGARYWSGDIGNDDLDGLTVFNDYWRYARILACEELTGQEIGQLLEFFNSEYGYPDWATAHRSIALVAPTASPADGDPEAFMRYAMQQRGHSVTVIASASLGSATLTAYDAVVYAGNYSGRNTNAPLIRTAIDSGVPTWVALREPGMGAFGFVTTESVACQLDLVSEVQGYFAAGWGNVTTQTTHDITDFLGTPPIAFGSRTAGASGWGDFAYIDSADSAVGTLILKMSLLEITYAIDAGTADLSAATLNAPVVISGIDNTTATAFFSEQGRQYFQHEIDWLLDTLSPPPILPVAFTGRRLLSPAFGQIVDPTAGVVTFEWTDLPGATATVSVTADISVVTPTWVKVGSTAPGVTTLAVDMSDAATYPEGIWWGWKIEWSDGTTWTSFGFKLLTITSTDAYGTTHVTGTDEAHAYIAFNPADVAGQGAQACSFLWDTTDQYWKPGSPPAHHLKNGLAAAPFAGYQDPGLQVPPGMPTGYMHYEISSYMRVGALGTIYFPFDTKYWAAEGQGCGVGLYAIGSDSSSKGIMAGAYINNIWPYQPCPTDGQGTVYFGIGYRDTPGALSVADFAPVSLPDPHAWPSTCALDNWLIPIRMVVTQINSATARVQAGMGGRDGSDYWLIDETIPFDFAAVGTDAGWSLFKILGAADTLGFRDMYSLSISASSSAGGLVPVGSNPSRPCIVELTVYEPDGTTIAWQATDDPADAAAIQILIEPDNYGAQIVDFLNGSASLATVNVGLIDPPTIAGDQDSGIMTGRLVDLTTNFGAIRGRRGRLRRYISPTIGWVTIVDGECMSPFLKDGYSSFGFSIRDSRERERKTTAFPKGETTCLLPRGVVMLGAGDFVLGGYIPNRDLEPGPPFAASLGPMYGTANHGTGSGFVTPGGYYQPGTAGHVTIALDGWVSGSKIDEEKLVVLADAEAEFAGQVDTMTAAGPDVTHEVQYPHIVVWWRPQGGVSADWVRVKPRYIATGRYAVPRGTGATPPTPPCVAVFDADFDTAVGTFEVRAAKEILLAPIGATTLPTDGQDVEVLLQYVGPPTDSMPFHWFGTLGELLTAAYDGEFSPRAPATFPPDKYLFEDGVAIPTGIRYDPAPFALMTETVVLRVTSPVDDLRDWLERFAYAPSGWAPALDNDGQVSPLHRRFPSNPVGLLTIDNSIAKAEPGWAHGTTIINLVRFDYGRLFHNPLNEDEVPSGVVDGLLVQEVQRWYAASGGNLPIEVTGPEFLAQISDSIAIFGVQQHTIEAAAFHAVQAIGLPFDPAVEQGSLLAADAAATLLPRYAFGTPIVDVAVRREPTSTQRAGNWVGLDLSWMPDYRTGRRGLRRYGQIFELPDLNCAWRRFRMELGEALNLLSYTGHSGGGSGGSAPYTSAPYGATAATGGLGSFALGTRTLGR